MNRRITYLCMILVCACLRAWADEHVRLTNLPHIYIETFTGRSISSKSTYVLARMWMVDEEDNVQFYDSLEIRGRGNSTWGLAKKPYRLKFHEKVKWLGKGYANTKNWTLLANHGDKSLIRNAISRELGEFVGLKFNPAAKFVDLTLNGKYVGNYQISDHVDVRPHRVNVEEQDLPLTEESNITGGYLLEADGFGDFQNGKSGFYSPKRSVPIRIHYPDEDDIVDRQYKYIRNFVYDFEQRLYDESFSDPAEGYRSRVDSISLANWYVASEVSGNPDAFWSAYFYKEQDDDRLFWGPLWDLDIAYANDNRIGDTSRKLMKDVAFGSSVMGPWIDRLWEDEWFVRLVNRRLGEVIDEGLEDFMLDKVDSLAGLLQRSQQLNYERWGINVRTLRECVLYSTYDQYVDDLRSYITTHIPYLKEAFASFLPDAPEPDPEHKVPTFVADTLAYYTISNLGTGTVFDVDAETGTICGNALDTESESQQWHIRPLANGYMHITNRMTGLALNDPTEGNPTATTQTGTQLNVAAPDTLDKRQQWDIATQLNERWNLVNRFSQHAANLSGGNHENGTHIVSYTSDGRNSSSSNRLWLIEATDWIVDGIEDIDNSKFKIQNPQWSMDNGQWSMDNGQWSMVNGQCDYALAYDAAGSRLHFGADNPSALTFAVHVYDRSGRQVRTFRASESCDVSALPRGLYIVSWRIQGRQHSVKFMK